MSSRVDFDGAHVLDLFAGTGMVSLEFLSRGAASVTAVEQAPKACRFATTQASKLGSDDLHTVCADVWGFLSKPLTQFDLVFADPPYDLPKLTELPSAVRSASILASRRVVCPGARRARGPVQPRGPRSDAEVWPRPFQFVYLRLNAHSSISWIL